MYVKQIIIYKMPPSDYTPDGIKPTAEHIKYTPEINKTNECNSRYMAKYIAVLKTQVFVRSKLNSRPNS